MAKKPQMTQKLNNVDTFFFYLNWMVTIANSVFMFENAPESIDPLWINNKLLKRTSIAFFVDDVLKELYALPYNVIGKRDLYGKPLKIRCYGQNGYRSDVLTRDKFVIMYDNLSYQPLYISIYQLAVRMTRIMRTIDININQQRTPRIFKTSNNKELSVKSFLQRVEEYEDAIITYKDMDLDDLEAVLSPAPYVADKLQDSKEAVWRDFCNLVGISNLDSDKKERMVVDEVIALQGGNYIGRYSRYLPRVHALKEIKQKFGIEMNLVCYDQVLEKEVFADMFKEREVNQ